jgi:flagellar hook-associated protein 3 FlgL
MLRFDGVSSIVMSSIPKLAVSRLQLALSHAQEEVTTGRHHDVGLVLGAKTGSSIRLRLQLSEFQHAGKLAELAASRAALTQTTLMAVSKLATDVLATLTGARDAVLGQDLARDSAETALSSLTDLMNTAFDGQFVFGGLNSDKPPMRIFEGGPPQAAVDAAFLQEFGVTQSDAAVASITGTDMRTFMDGALADLFEPAAWNASWTSASASNPLTRLGAEQFVDASANANDTFAPRIAQALTVMLGLGQGNLSQSAFEATVERAIELLAQAQDDIGQVQSRIGLSQQRLTAGGEMFAGRAGAATRAIQALESVDSYEAAAKVNVLMTELEASYALTGRISRMSLLSYI